MNRFQKWSASNGMSTGRAIGFLALMGFALFVAFRIFTPPTEEIQRITAPDGSREARLMLVYYYSEPGYKVAARTRSLWHTLVYLPEYKDESTAERNASIRWSEDSRQLFFEMNGKVIWSEQF
jgi:hypothetical protein